MVFYKKHYIGLDFGGNSAIINLQRLQANSNIDVITLDVQGFSSTQGSSIVKFSNGGGETIWEVASGSIIKSYKDTIVSGHVQYNHHVSKIVSGTFINPNLSGQYGDFFTGHVMGLLTFANPVTFVYLLIDNFVSGGESMSSFTYRIPVNRRCKAKEVAVNAFSISVASGWVLTLFKNGTGCGTFPFEVGVNPASAYTSGVWIPMSGQNLIFNPGDNYFIAASGFGANALLCIANNGWETQ